MDIKMLISSVKMYEELYNWTHPKYHDKKHIENVWEFIGHMINWPGFECKNKWRYLRNRYVQIMRQQQSSGYLKEQTKPWKYENELTFLTPFIETKHDDVQNNDSNQSNSDSENEEFIDALTETDQLTSETLDIKLEIEENWEDNMNDLPLHHLLEGGDNISENEQLHDTETPSRSRRAKHKVDEEEITVEEVMIPDYFGLNSNQQKPQIDHITNSKKISRIILPRYFKEDKLCTSTPEKIGIGGVRKIVNKRTSTIRPLLPRKLARDRSDPIDLFFSSMKATVKQMSPYFQHVAKNKIQKIVTTLQNQTVNESK